MPYFVVIEELTAPGGGDPLKQATLLFKLSNGADWMEICSVNDVPNVRFAPETWLDISHSIIGKDHPFSDHVPGPETKVNAELLHCAAATYGYDGNEQKLLLKDSKIVVDESVGLGCELGTGDIEKLFDEHIFFEADDASYRVYMAKRGCVCIDR
jgi:hypothetical protein